MFDLFRRKPDQPAKQMSDADRSWRDIEFNTMSLMKDFSKDSFLFAMLAGAVLALQQDTLKAYGVDMRNTDSFSGIAIDAVLRTKGRLAREFPERLALTLKAMNGVANMNLDVIEAGQPANMAADDYRLHALMARMRATAAHLWLLTLHSRVNDDSGMKFGVSNMWMLMQLAPTDELIKRANIFTGTYFDGVRSDQMNLHDWPCVT